MNFNRVRLLYAMAIALSWAFSTAPSQTAAQDIEINHYTHRGCVAGDGKRLLPVYALKGEIARVRKGSDWSCEDVVNSAILACERAVEARYSWQNAQHAECLPVFASEVTHCLAHYGNERRKCTGTNAEKEREDRERLEWEAERERLEWEAERERLASEAEAEAQERREWEAKRERLALAEEHERLALEAERERREHALEERRRAQAQRAREQELERQRLARERQRLEEERARQLAKQQRERERIAQLQREQEDAEAAAQGSALDSIITGFGLGALVGSVITGDDEAVDAAARLLSDIAGSTYVPSDSYSSGGSGCEQIGERLAHNLESLSGSNGMCAIYSGTAQAYSQARNELAATGCASSQELAGLDQAIAEARRGARSVCE